MYVIYEIYGIIKACKVLCCDFVNRHIEKLLTRAVAFRTFTVPSFHFFPANRNIVGRGPRSSLKHNKLCVCLCIDNVPTFERVADNLSADEWPWMRHLGAEGRTTLHLVKLWIHYSSELGFQCATSWHLQLFSFCKWQTWHSNLLHGSKALPRIWHPLYILH